ncbi:MAG: SUMF1/EgtB/PvdO family nonheme iron enzyme [Planctomycetes bacterium]|nr:SUMF1/EgtB/PvdO family nonheme iron enzyme [Planctomycetota bacterium]
MKRKKTPRSRKPGSGAAQADSEYRALVLAARDAGGFRLLLAVHDDPAVRRDVAARLETDLRARSIDLVQVDLAESPEEGTLLETVHSRVEAASRSDARLVVSVVGLDSRLDFSPGAPVGVRFLEDANLHRDAFPKACPFPLIFWLTPLAATALARSAPDLSHWRSATFDFCGPLRVDPSDFASTSALEKHEHVAALVERLQRLESVPGADSPAQLRAKADLLVRLGIAQLATGAIRKAVDILTRALEIARQIGDPRIEGRVLGNLGMARLQAGDVRDGIQLHEEQLEIARRVGDRESENMALLHLGVGHSKLDDRATAIRLWTECADRARESRNWPMERKAAGNLVIGHLKQDDHAAALRLAERELQCASEFGDRAGVAEFESLLSQAQLLAGDLVQAVEHGERSLEMARELGDRLLEAQASWNLGLAYQHAGELPKALELMRVRLEYAREIQLPDLEKTSAQVAALEERVVGKEPKTQGTTKQTVEAWKEPLEPLRRRLHEGKNVVLPLVGSGISQGLPSWRAVVRELLDRVKPVAARDEIVQLHGKPEEDRADLLGLASEIEIELGKEAVRDVLKRTFERPAAPAPSVYELIAALPVDHFATTNWDPWLSSAVRRKHLGETVQVFTPMDPEGFENVLADAAATVWMLHGDAARPASCVLTRGAYDSLILNNRTWRTGVTTLLHHRTWLFLGYSLTDPDVEFLLKLWKQVYPESGTKHLLLTAEPSPRRARALRALGVDVVEYSSDHGHAELSRILRFLATPPVSPPVAGTTKTKKGAASTAPPDAWWKHVEFECSGVLLSGLLGDKPAPPLKLEDVYVPLLAPRTDLEPRVEAKTERDDDTLKTLVKALQEDAAKVADKVLTAALRGAGVGKDDASAKATVEDTRRRLLEIPKNRLDGEAVRRVLATLELDAVLRRHKRLLVEGDPGSGKTTTLKHVAMALVKAHRGEGDAARCMGFAAGAVPVFVPLRDFWTHLRSAKSHDPDCAARLLEYLEKQLDAHGGSAWLAAALEEGRAVLLLDGLDEVLDPALRTRAAAIIREFLQEHERCPFVVSSRPSGLQEGNRHAFQSVGLVHAQVQDLDEERVARFVRAWYRALIANPDKAEAETQDLLHRIAGKAARTIRDFTRKPILLTALAVVHQTTARLPERKADLYEHCVRALTYLWDDVKFRDMADRQDVFTADDKLKLLQRIAAYMFRNDSQTIEREAVIRLVCGLPGGKGLDHLREALEEAGADDAARSRLEGALGRALELPEVRNVAELRALVERARDLPNEVNRADLQHYLDLSAGIPGGRDLGEMQIQTALAALAERSGVLIPEGFEGYRFRHFSFQEFLMARWLGREAKQKIIALAPRIPDWPDVAQLAVGYRAIGSPQDATMMARDLLADGLAAAAEQPQRKHKVLEVTARTILDLIEYQAPDLALVWKKEKDAFLGVLNDREQKADFACRLAVGEMLGKLGDPRLADEERWVEVPAGPFRMGSDEGAPDEKPVRRVHVSAFRIQRWPVTIGEYGTFVLDGGYGEWKLWDAEGWEWRSKKSEETPGRWERQLQKPSNHPVTGMSWWAAQAFCRWLSRRTRNLPEGFEIRLPTEAEWEKAARGGLELANGRENPAPDREYPWDGELDESKVNGWKLGHRGTTPVGIFPAGHGPYGTWDQSGNVWEWCGDWYGPYRKDDLKDPTGPEKGEYRAARGGSFAFIRRSLRVSFRLGWWQPELRGDVLGFRCVAAPVRGP